MLGATKLDETAGLLHHACSYGAVDAVKALVEHGADPMKADGAGCLPVHLASSSPKPQAWRCIAPMVAAAGGNLLTVSGGTSVGAPLAVAVRHGRLAAARELLRLGAPVK